MSIPSITLRLDFGEGSSSGVSGGISLQGEAPTPMGFGSGLAGVTQADLPTPLPFASIAAAAAQGSAPTPMSGIGGMSAAMNAPPVPSLDIASARVSGMTDDMPRPEGEPEVVKKKPTGKN